MKNRKYERNTVDKLAIKGVLSKDCSFITYENDDKENETITLKKCFAPFAGQEISFILSNKTMENLEDEFEEE